MRYLTDAGDADDAVPRLDGDQTGERVDVLDLTASGPGRDEQAEAERELSPTIHRMHGVVVARRHHQPAAVNHASQSVLGERRRHGDEALLSIRAVQRKGRGYGECSDAMDLTGESAVRIPH